MYTNKYQKYIKKISLLQNGSGHGDSSNVSQTGDEFPLAKIVQLELNDKEKDIVKKIKIEITLHIDISYDKSNILDNISDFIKRIGDNESIVDDISKIIKKIIKNVLEHEKEESGIIWLRATTYYKDELKFRWHRDGLYSKHMPEKKSIYKFATSLKGESTPVVIDKYAIEKFNVANKNKQEIENCIWNYIGKNNININDVPKELFDGVRKLTNPELIKAIGDKYIQAKTLEEGVYFLNSIKGSSYNSEIGAIHSEPEIQENRLFLAILPCPKDVADAWIKK